MIVVQRSQAEIANLDEVAPKRDSVGKPQRPAPGKSTMALRVSAYAMLQAFFPQARGPCLRQTRSLQRPDTRWPLLL